MGKTRHRVHFRKENVTLEVIEGTNLRQACLDNGIDPYPWLKGLLSCRGKGFCGTCLVETDEPSAFGEPSKREAKWLEKRHGDVWEKMRLSCQCVVQGDANVVTNPNKREGWKRHGSYSGRPTRSWKLT